MKCCWQSLFGAPAIYYRGQQENSQSDMDIAVVIQRQIPSTRAGVSVMFTIDPATGDRNHLVIEGFFGLGESVVSGQVSPDRYVVEKWGMTIPRAVGAAQRANDRGGARRRHRQARAQRGGESSPGC